MEYSNNDLWIICSEQGCEQSIFEGKIYTSQKEAENIIKEYNQFRVITLSHFLLIYGDEKYESGYDMGFSADENNYIK